MEQKKYEFIDSKYFNVQVQVQWAKMSHKNIKISSAISYAGCSLLRA
jgi:hypothetical protein